MHLTPQLDLCLSQSVMTRVNRDSAHLICSIYMNWWHLASLLKLMEGIASVVI